MKEGLTITDDNKSNGNATPNWCLNLEENIMNDKTPLLHKYLRYQMPNKRLQLMSDYIYLVLLQRELFPTMFYTTGSSPLLVTNCLASSAFH